MYAILKHDELQMVIKVLARRHKSLIETDLFLPVYLLLSECAQVDSALARQPGKSRRREVFSTDLAIDSGEEDALNSFAFWGDDDDVETKS